MTRSSLCSHADDKRGDTIQYDTPKRVSWSKDSDAISNRAQNTMQCVDDARPGKTKTTVDNTARTYA